MAEALTMGLPRITPNGDYGNGGERVARIASEADPGEFRKAISDVKCAHVAKSNPYNKNGQPIRHTDSQTGATHLTYYGQKVANAIAIGVLGPRTFLQLVLEDGDREPYACSSTEELEWIRKGLGDFNPFEL